ncbi:NEL-type E3 ubiquitin ligase domain-containing protein [Pseudomonas karstica]|uniref:NEL-type E3 ubiquitin ligase domain-containing protein n=1 Tax=Pseudomonas karstica TaxID=1055468 RepID=UPI0015B712E7|nr:NEL-type E3 ubiquitin ligase domain-containing protein [Pseudomonas karstica]
MTPTPSVEKGPHYALIQQVAPQWLTSTAVPRIHALHAAGLNKAPWYDSADTSGHQALKAANAEGWRTQNAVDQKLSDLQDAYAFAEPLLKNAILDKYDLDLDVKTTFLHLYIPKKLPWYAVDFSNGVTSRIVSLLDAALHNFADSETFEKDSSYISKPDYRGHSIILHHNHKMPIEAFKSLCRELDLGTLYQQHLNNYLLPDNVVATTVLQTQVIASQKAALKAAAHMARLKTDAQGYYDLSDSGHRALMRILDGDPGRLQFYQISLLEAPLTGVLLIAADLEKTTRVSRLIAYIPHDPESPVKEYASPQDFMRDLIRKLQTNAVLQSSQQVPKQTYRQFFSQFVGHDKRGYFFAGLEQRLCKVKWRKKDPLDPGPTWLEVAVDNPDLKMSAQKIHGDLWKQRYQASLNKILNDARTIAVPTADADSNTRWAWWANFTKILSDILNIALMVAAPFVPGLGELMLAYTAYQLASDLIEGIVDLTQGQFEEAAEHIVGVVTDVVQLLAMVGGGVLANQVIFKASPFVNGMRAVTVNDKPRLWSPDLSPYVDRNLRLPEGSKPDELGLHAHEQKKVLPLEDQHYVLNHDAQSDTYRIKHPTRPQAYSPVVEHNGKGAWVHEGEDPWSWQDDKLRSRLGHSTQGLTPEQVEQAGILSGTRPNALRKMYIDLEPPPPLLADSLKRQQLYDKATSLSEKIRAGQPADESFHWSAQLSSEFENWPSDKAIQVFDNVELAGPPLTYGAQDADAAHSLKISQQDLDNGKLPEQLTTFLTEPELQALLPEPLPPTQAARTSALRAQLADELAGQKTAIFNHLYSTSEVLDSAPAKLLKKHFPQLPAELVEKLMLRTSPGEVAIMANEQRIPLRLKNLATALENETIASHAFEGFYNDDLITADTERMALNLLRQQTDTFNDLSISVHDHSPSGKLRCQAGPTDAGTQKILLRKTNGRYAIHDPTSKAPATQYDFFEALLRVVPQTSEGYVPGQGRAFKLWLKDQLVEPAVRRTVIEEPTLRQTDERITQTLLQRPMLGAFRDLFRSQPPALHERVSAVFPSMTEARAQEFVQKLNALDNGPAILSGLEAERKTLLQDLSDWKKKPTFGQRYSMLAANEQLMRDRIIDELKLCWENRSRGELSADGLAPPGTKLDLSELVLGRYMRSMGRLRSNFDHVTTLVVDNTRLTHRDLGFLENFPNLRALDLSDNEIDRVPKELVTLPRLTKLDISANPIPWDSEDFEVLYRCKGLESLNLQDHAELRVAPDVRRMPHLQQMVLRRTSINQWPEGIELPRESDLELDLLDTQIKTIPEYLPDSPGARVVGRSWLDRTQLDAADGVRFADYRRASGIDPDRVIPPGNPDDLQFWLTGLSPETSSGAQAIWDDLEHERDSEGFFNVLKMLRPPELVQTAADRQLYDLGAEDLRRRVWDMLVAMDRDTELRQQLFINASAPANCPDAGANIFNSMGVKVMLADIFADTSAVGLAVREGKLVSLAKQKWRLDTLNKHISAEVKRRLELIAKGEGQQFGEGGVDETEVYLGYQTALKTRLDLPWMSEHMVYRDTAQVTQAQLDSAYREVIKAEANNGLVDGMLKEIEFWRPYLEDTYRSQLQAAHSARETAGSELEDVFEAHQEWVADDTSPERKEQLRTQMTAQVEHLNHLGAAISADTVLVDQPMSDATRKVLYDAVEQSYQELQRNLTRQAMTNAGL